MIPPVIQPEHYRQRVRLLAVIRTAEQHGWKHTLQHAQEQFYLLGLGKITKVF